MGNTFLKATWRNLILVNYTVDPEVLLPYLPAHTELDLWDNKCYVSIVAFMFKHTKVMGLSMPFHRDFEEVNLRFYVKHLDENNEWKRGVVFIKEIVPKPLITFVANKLYGEHYTTAEMSHHFIEKDSRLNIQYRWRNGFNYNSLDCVAEKKTTSIKPDSLSEFITEHYWGFTKINNSTTYKYEVKHPRWEAHNVLKHSVKIDMASLYGNDFAFLQTQNPASIILARGSEITVGNKQKVRG